MRLASAASALLLAVECTDDNVASLSALGVISRPNARSGCAQLETK
jgi:hypothetical protein